jgi:heptosyltransferase II
MRMASELASLKRIVIIDPAYLGDTVFNGPLVRALRQQAPAAQIDIVVRPPSDVIGKRMEGINRVHVFDKRKLDAGLSGLRRMARRLSEEAYDMALIPHPSARSTLLAFLANIPRRIGHAKGLAGLFLTKRIAIEQDDSFVKHRLRLIGAQTEALSLAKILRPNSSNESTRAKTRVGLCMGSAWATKAWSKNQAQELLNLLEPERIEIVFLGAEWERDRFQGLTAGAGQIVDRIGQPLDDMIEDIAACDLVIAGDTGPLHIARALAVPVVALFGPTPESKHDFSPKDAVLFEDLGCRPCSPHGHQICPLGHHACMEDLAASKVHHAALNVVQS